ncbi:conserved hypothetical protein [Rubrivivax sp. A210]|nr:conserved hypothetical protein [Rubrivivax sp. A210]
MWALSTSPASTTALRAEEKNPMSYILDALRRADAERLRGQVPGLGAQPVLAEEPEPPRRLVPVALAAGAVLAAAALAWWWLAAPATVPPHKPPVRDQAAAVPAPPPARAVAAPAPFPLVVSAPAPSLAPAPAPASAAPKPVPVMAPAPVAAPASPVATVPAVAPVPAPAPAGSRASPAAVPLAALSAEQRRELPPLVLGGSIWSESAAQRFIIVNGQVVHEGDVLAPGLTLERISQRAAVLRWRELRIELPL